MLTVTDIKKSYGQTQALRSVSVSVEQEQIVALLARNGAGKSTLISIIAGLLSADEGSICINNTVRQGKQFARSIQQKIGLAAQDSGIYPGLSVYDNLAFFCELYGIGRQYRSLRIHEIANLLELSELLKRNAGELSGGERRRLHTGCALLHKPAILLLDEPTVGADPHARNTILDAVKTIAKEGTAVLYTSHYLAEIEVLGADIIVMEKGQVLESGSQQQLIQRYSEHSLIVAFSQNIAAVAAQRLSSSPIFSSDLFSIDCCLSKNQLNITSNNSMLTPPILLKALGDYSHFVTNIQRKLDDLENVFLSIIQERTLKQACH